MSNPFDPKCEHAIPTSYSDRWMCGLRTEMSMRCYSCGDICSYKKTHETKFQKPKGVNMKRYNVQYGVGRIKYIVNYHDGVKKHNDGSDFFDIATFSNYAKFKSFVIKLNLDGFKES